MNKSFWFPAENEIMRRVRGESRIRVESTDNMIVLLTLEERSWQLNLKRWIESRWIRHVL